MVITIQIWFDLIRFRKHLSVRGVDCVCRYATLRVRPQHAMQLFVQLLQQPLAETNQQRANGYCKQLHEKCIVASLRGHSES